MTGATIITGATGELAPAVISALVARGDRLLLVGRNTERLNEVAVNFGAPGVVETFAADVGDPRQAAEVAEAAVHRFGSVAGLVHMVGGFGASPVVFTTPATYEELLAANFLSAVTATQALLPQLSEGGHLVYFSTPLAEEPLRAMSGYAAAKAALVAWVRSLSHEVKHMGIHANIVSMTVADTPSKRAERPDWDFDQTVAPEVVAEVVEFLTGPGAVGLYGACIPVLGRFGFTSDLSGPPPVLVGEST
jgi:NAD(P)-dependent dehydrogenase (short-subunit alcohol dehydrogenase family)